MSDTQLSRRAMLSAAAVTAAGAAASQLSGQTAGEPTAAHSSAGKAAVVTGSSRGIGAAIARRLARDGYAVTVNCLTNRNLALGIVRDIEAAGGRATFPAGRRRGPARGQDAVRRQPGGVRRRRCRRQ